MAKEIHQQAEGKKWMICFLLAISWSFAILKGVETWQESFLRFYLITALLLVVAARLITLKEEKGAVLSTIECMGYSMAISLILLGAWSLWIAK